MEKPRGSLYLGEQVDPATHERTGDRVHYDASRLTTHGVIVGMTGSGKTGLGVVLLEEALLEGVPCMVIDPKGDMGNLLLTFPDLAPSDFTPWVNPGDASRKEMTPEAYAAKTAQTWKDGLESWGVSPSRIRTLRDGARFTIYTPGSTAGVPLNLVGGVSAPPGTDLEVVRDEIEGFVTGLLGLVGVKADPITSREHVLLSNLVERAWTQGVVLDVPALVGQIQSPPLRKLGVFDLDTFFPPGDRLQLAMRLNGLIASPSFEVWTRGPALDPGTMLAPADGRTPAAIISLAHLSEDERQFVVTLLLTRVVSWMRAQSGTTDLRALIYMDEVFGYVPPSAMPPSKKPILTILKQARAFGVGMVLSTQNPVDVDYKALSNSGTWLIGRLQTERDKGRLLDGLRSAGGGVDIDALGNTISGLGKREFVLHSTKSRDPLVFGTRWAMSYLRGPLTRGQIQTLMEGRLAASGPSGEQPAGPTPSSTAAPATEPAAYDESPVMPKVADGIPVYFLDPAAEWATAVGAKPGSPRLEPALVARVDMLFDDDRAGVRHRDAWETVFFPLGERIDPAEGSPVDYDDRDFRDDPPTSAHYVLTDAPLDKKTWFNAVKSQLKEHLHGVRAVEIWKNPILKLYSRVGESKEDFLARCHLVAESREDEDAAKLRSGFETKFNRVRDQINKAEDRVEELEGDTRSRKQQELVSGVGSLVSVFLGGRSSTRRIATTINRMSTKRGMTARTAQRLESAQNRVDEKREDLEELEDELSDAIIAIDDKWREAAEHVEAMTVGLEKTDIRVDEVALVWVPR